MPAIEPQLARDAAEVLDMFMCFYRLSGWEEDPAYVRARAVLDGFSRLPEYREAGAINGTPLYMRYPK